MEKIALEKAKVSVTLTALYSQLGVAVNFVFTFA